MKKSKAVKVVRIVEKIIRWVFYVELVLLGMTVLSYLSDGAWGIGSLVIPPFSILITILSIFVITKLRYISNLVRIAIVLNWVVIVMLIYNVTD
jgi:hypothetical protein